VHYERVSTDRILYLVTANRKHDGSVTGRPDPATVALIAGCTQQTGTHDGSVDSWLDQRLRAGKMTVALMAAWTRGPLAHGKDD